MGQDRRATRVNLGANPLTTAEAVALLRNHQVVAYPTEAIFGLGCDPESYLAVKGLLNLKQRELQHGLILVASNYEQLLPYIDDHALTTIARARVIQQRSRPITWAVPAIPTVPTWLTGDFNSLAVRISSHSTIQLICEQFGKPLTSTSANRHGQPPCRTFSEVRSQFGPNFPIVEGEIGEFANPSEIRDALTDRCLRPG